MRTQSECHCQCGAHAWVAKITDLLYICTLSRNKTRLETVNTVRTASNTVVDRAQRKLQQGPRQGIQADAPGPAAPLAPHAQADGVVGLLTEA